MIINVKSTRGETDDQQPPQPYRFDDEPKSSRLPMAIIAFLAGIVLYLKSMFPGWGEDEAEAQPGKATPDTGKPKASQDVVPTGEAGLRNDDAQSRPGEMETPHDHPIGSAGRLVELRPPAAFEKIFSPEYEFFDYASFGPAPAKPSSFTGSLVANDNPVPGSTDQGPDTPEDGPGQDSAEPGGPDNSYPDEDADEQTNRAPRVSGPVYLADVAGCSIALIGLSELLANTVDPDGDTLSITNFTVSSGTVTASEDHWLFKAVGYGPVTITYEISDGQLAVTQTAYFDVVRNSIPGTSGDDPLLGTECGDDIAGRDGHDNIDARGGDDTVLGGGGHDHIVAGGGADIVFAGPGDDIVFGGDGDDWISGGTGDDRLFGDWGDDTLLGEAGNDRLSGGAGKDLLFGGWGDDFLSGDDGEDRLWGGEGDDDLAGGDGDDIVMGEMGADLLRGSSGNDTMSGGDGSDEVEAGDGDDFVIGDLDAAADSYSGGEGVDTLSYAAARRSVIVDLDGGEAEGGEIGTDQVCFFEVVETGAGADIILGSDANEKLVGHEGDDSISGRGGRDVLGGGDGCDTLSGGEGEDQILAGAGDDTVIGDLDGDDDRYDGGAGIDTLDYSDATASISFDLAHGRVTGLEVGEDTISNFELFVGGEGNDHFVGSERSVSFLGGAGNDVFEFSALSTPGQSVAYEILDFMVGDRIKVSTYEIFEEVMDHLEDRFEDVYGDDVDDDDLPIQISHKYTGDIRQTLIEADLNNDDHYELAITIYGDSQVTVVETT